MLFPVVFIFPAEAYDLEEEIKKRTESIFPNGGVFFLPLPQNEALMGEAIQQIKIKI